MDDECIQLKDVPIYRPPSIKRRVTIQEEIVIPQVEQRDQQIVNTQNLLEELVDQLIVILNEKDINPQNITNIIYQVILNIGWSIFDRRTAPVQLDKCKIVKHQCIHFFQRLRKHFQLNVSDKLTLLLSKLYKLQLETEDEQIESLKLFQRKNTMMKSSYNNIKTNQSFELNEDQQKEIEFRDQKLKELQQKLDYKDNAIKDMTQGYLKDVQHMKELLFRKNDKNTQQMFEVQYFDSKEGFDEEQTQLLNQKIKGIQQQFSQKYNESTSIIQSLTYENKQYQAQIEKFKDKLKLNDTSLGLLARVLQMDNNDPYLTWKSIQDLKGNQYFFQVFENPKHTYGINYREIDKLLLSSKANQREINYYKQQLDQQLSAFAERQIVYIKDLQNDLEQKTKDIEQIKNNEQLIIQECLQQSREEITKSLEHRKTEMLQKLFQQFNELNEVKASIDQFKAKQMFNKWILINRMLRCVKQTRDQQILRQELKEVILGRKEIEDQINELKNKWKKKKQILRAQYDDLKQKYEEDKFNQIFWQYKYSTYQKMEQVYKNEIQLLQQQQSQDQEQIKQITQKYQVICLHYQQLYRIFDQSKLNFDKIDKSKTKIIEQKLKQVDQNKEYLALQILQQQQQQQIKQDKILETLNQRSKQCQTQIQNIKTPIQNSNLNYDLIEKVIQLKLSLNDTSTKATNTELEINQKNIPITQDFSVQVILESISSIQNSFICQNCKRSICADNQRSVRTPSQICLLEEFSERADTKQNQSQEQKKQQQFKQVETEINDEKLDIIRRDSLKFSKEDFSRKQFESQLLQEKNRLKIKTPQTPLQASLRVKDQLEQITYHSSQKHNVDQQQDIFQRLYKDSVSRKQRLQILKNNIETLDQFKWEQILQIIQHSPIENNRGLSQKSSKRPKMFYHKNQFRDVDIRLSDQERNYSRLTQKRVSNNKTYHIQRNQQMSKQNTTFDFALQRGGTMYKF